MLQLVVTELSKEFPAAGEPLVVLREVSFSLAAGESLAILGPSGSGKSTLLHILGTLESPTSGQVTLAGHDTTQLPVAELAHFRNDQIGFVFQDHHLLPQCTILENVLIPAMAFGKVTAEARQNALALIERVGLTDRITHRPAELSGGERQRVAIARSLLNGPTLLLADEPTGNLDRATAESIGGLLLELVEEKQMMLILVTHSRELAATTSRRMELEDGRLKEID